MSACKERESSCGESLSWGRFVEICHGGPCGAFVEENFVVTSVVMVIEIDTGTAVS